MMMRNFIKAGAMRFAEVLLGWVEFLLRWLAGGVVADELVDAPATYSPRAVVLYGGGMDGHEVGDVVVEKTEVLLLRDTVSELWWTYERMTGPRGMVLRRDGKVVYGNPCCVGVTGMRVKGKEGML